MTENTNLEKLEKQSELIFGGPKGLGAVDKSMLEMTPTNKLVIDSRQSELLITIGMLYGTLRALDNRKPKYEAFQDSQTGKWRKKRVYVDNWAWLKDIAKDVKENQLTIKGYSRFQHLRQHAQMIGIAAEEEQRGWLARLFGG